MLRCGFVVQADVESSDSGPVPKAIAETQTDKKRVRRSTIMRTERLLLLLLLKCNAGGTLFRSLSRIYIEINFSGLRPGEKLFEQLFHELEPYEQTTHEKILLAHPRAADWDELRSELRGSELAVRRYDTDSLQKSLIRLVPELAKSGFNTEPAKVIPIHRSS